MEGRREQEVERALTAAKTELDAARTTLERARQRLLDFDTGGGVPAAMLSDAIDQLKIDVDRDLRAVLKFLGCES